MPDRIHGGYMGRKQYQKQLDEAEASAKKKVSAGATQERESQSYLDKLSEELANINIPKSVREIFKK